MTARELEEEFLPQALVRGSLILFEASVAAQLIRRCFDAQLRFLGVEAFRLWDDGGVQPAMEFSNISFGRIAKINSELTVESFKRQPGSNQHQDTLELIDKGAKAGYLWFEVSIEDPDTDELLFFRKLDGQQVH